MAHIYVPVISPLSVSGTFHDADASHIHSYHVAYEIAALSRKLDDLIAQYDIEANQVKAMQQNKKASSKDLKAAEKHLLASMLPHKIKSLRARLALLNADLRMMTSRI